MSEMEPFEPNEKEKETPQQEDRSHEVETEEEGSTGDYTHAGRDAIRSKLIKRVYTGPHTEHHNHGPTYVLGDSSHSTPPTAPSPPPPAEEPDQPPVEEAPDDPTVIVEELPSPVIEMPAEFVDTCFERLRQEHLLVLTCFDTTVLLSAGFLVANRFTGDKRLFNLEFSEEEPSRTLNQQEVTFDTVLHDKLPWSPETLVVAAATSLGAQSFVDSIARGPSTSIAAQSGLQQRDRFLLLLTTPEMVSRSEMVSPSEFLRSVSVPFLEPRLKALFPDQAKKWVKEIERQKRAGQWGENEKRFWELFDDYRRRGSIEQAIELRRGASERAGTTGPGIQGPRINAGADLENAVLFLAVFFPSLPLEDFQQLLLRHIGDKVRTIKKTKVVFGDYGEELTREVEEEQRLADQWFEDYEQIYERCHLVVLPPVQETGLAASSRSGTRGPVIDFRLPDIRDQVRRQFLGIQYHMTVHLFAQVREQRSLFETSPPVMEGTLQLMQTMAIIDTHRYGTDMLLELLDLQDGTRESAPKKPAIGSGPLDRRLVLSRLYLLIREFLKTPALAGVIDSFINELIGKGRHDDALELVKRLRFAPEFDQVAWWKQLFDRGNREARDKTFEEMTAALRAGGSQFSETLHKISDWLPEPAKPSSARESTDRAHRLLFELLQTLIRHSRFRRIGVWPPEDPLQVALCDLNSGEGELSLIQWLFHPSFVDYLKEEPQEESTGTGRDEYKRGYRHYPNLMVWTWILGPIRKQVQIDAKSLGSRWYWHFHNLGEEDASHSCPPAFQALVLADLALSCYGVEPSDGEGAPAQQLAQVVGATVAALPDRRHRLLVKEYWGGMKKLIQEVGACGRAAGTSLEAFERAKARLTAQYRSLSLLLTMFRQGIQN